MNDSAATGSAAFVCSTDLLAAIVESAPIALILSDPTGAMRLVNREAEILFGYPRGELIGRCIDMLVPQPTRSAHADLRRAYLARPNARRMGIGRELFGVRKDGAQVPVEIALETIETEGGPLVLGVIADIRQRRRLEADVRRANDELEQRVRDRTAELERANLDKETLLTELRAQRAELERLSREDPLTHLSNRRDFDQRLNAEIARAQRLNSSLAVAMLDLDRFKLVNDRFGHALGDAVLREVAELIRQQCRSIDGIARYGGEEFALALPGADLHAGAHLCERIRLAFEHFDWSRLHVDLAVTVSCGVSAWSAGLDAAALLEQADANLYEAKRGGRNLVVPAVAPSA